MLLQVCLRSYYNLQITISFDIETSMMYLYLRVMTFERYDMYVIVCE